MVHFYVSIYIHSFAKKQNVRIALENDENFEVIKTILSEYEPDYVGLCYDSGHGNLISDGLGCLESLKDRLVSVHLHDNDGSGDQHNLLFSGTVDWTRLARIIAASAYAKCVSMETTMVNASISKEEVFLARAQETGEKLARTIQEQRSSFHERP